MQIDLATSDVQTTRCGHPVDAADHQIGPRTGVTAKLNHICSAAVFLATVQ